MEWTLELNELTPGLLPVFSADRGLFWIQVDADKTFLSHDNLAGGGGNLFSNCPASSFPDRQMLFREHFASCDLCYFKPWKRSRPTWNLCQDLKPSAASGQTSTYCTQYIFPPPEQHLYNREYDEHNIFGGSWGFLETFSLFGRIVLAALAHPSKVHAEQESLRSFSEPPSENPEIFLDGELRCCLEDMDLDNEDLILLLGIS